MTLKSSLFEEEEQIISDAQALLDQDPDLLPAETFAALLNQYKRLYRQSKRLVNIGDRMQGQLNRVCDQLTQSEEKFRNIFERSIQGIFRSTTEGRLLDLNPAMARIFGYGSSEEMIQSVRDVTTALYFSQDQRRDFLRALQEQGTVKDYPLKLRRRDGEAIWVEISAKGILDRNGYLVEMEGLVADVTEKRRMLEELENLARVDGLTGLWNRRYFLELGQREVARAQREGHPLTMVYFDVDRFKTINDTYGHQAGDQVLKEIAAIGRCHLREPDIFGRMGGDEFAILLPGTDRQGATCVAERFRAAFATQAVILARARVHFEASFGVAQFSGPTSSLSGLIQRADQALYEAKREGRNKVSCGPAQPLDMDGCIPHRLFQG